MCLRTSLAVYVSTFFLDVIRLPIFYFIFRMMPLLLVIVILLVRITAYCVLWFFFTAALAVLISCGFILGCSYVYTL